MKKFFILFAAATLFAGGYNAMYAQKGVENYGEAFVAQEVMSVNALNKTMKDKTEADVTVEGTITSVCQAKGCWIKLKNDKGEDVMVKFKDYAFFMPKDIAGKKAVVHGVAVKEVVSVEEQKHMLEDAHASAKEIAAVKKPKEELRIVASGVQVK